MSGFSSVSCGRNTALLGSLTSDRLRTRTWLRDLSSMSWRMEHWVSSGIVSTSKAFG